MIAACVIVLQVMLLPEAHATLTVQNVTVPTRSIGAPVVVSTAILLAGDETDQGTPLRIVGVRDGQYGKARLIDGAVRYIPSAIFPGEDTITLVVSDGVDSEEVNARIANPFFAAVGKWEAPISDPSVSPPTHQSSGHISLNMARSGAFTGKVTVAGATYALKGLFPLNGHLSVILGQFGKAPVQLQIDGQKGAGPSFIGHARYLVGGAAYDGTFNLSPTYQDAAPDPLLGSYTLAIGNHFETWSPPSGPDPVNRPSFAGYAAIRVSARGQAKIVGKLSNGRAFSSASLVQHDAENLIGAIPIFFLIEGGKGSFVGSADVIGPAGVNRGMSATYNLVQGTAGWFLPPDALGAGPNTSLQIIGSTHIEPRRGAPLSSIPGFYPVFSFQAKGGGMPSALFAQGAFGAYPISGKFEAQFSTSQIRPCLNICPVDGTFSGSFSAGRGIPAIPFTGVFLTLPDPGRYPVGIGFFTSHGQQGSVILGARGG